MRLLWLVCLAIILPSVAHAAANTFAQDVQMCSGRPWIDVTCPLGGSGTGADPTGAADSTAAINAAVSAGITNGWPVLFPAGTYKVGSKITVDYQGQAGNGFEIIGRGATIDGRTVTSGNVLQVQCSGGTVASPVVCHNLRISGQLTVLGTTNSYVVVIGKTDFSDRHDGARIEHLVVVNNNNNSGAGAVQLNYVTGADLWLSGSTPGGSSSTGAVALEQVQSSRVAGYGSALGASAPALLLENGASGSNSFVGFEYDPNTSTCISITSANAVRNAWLAPSFPCATAVNASGTAAQNALIGPSFSGTNMGPTSPGIAVVGRGALNRYSAPAVASRTLFGADDGTIFSAVNGTGAGVQWAGASLAITLPDAAAVGSGWTTGFVSENGKAVVLTVPAGRYIVVNGRQLSTLTVGASGPPGMGDFETMVLKSDGSNYRVEYLSQGAALLNNVQTAWPARWYKPGGPGYQLTVGDNGGAISSSATSSGLAVVLPQISSLYYGWMVGLSADNGKAITVTVNGTNGGTFLVGGAVQTSMTLPAGSMTWIQYDGAASFHDLRGGTSVYTAQPWIPIVPTGNLGNYLASFSVQGPDNTASPKGQIELSVGMEVTTGLYGDPINVSGSQDRVAFFPGCHAIGNQAGACWAENPVTYLDNTLTVGAAHHQISEMDMVNGYKDTDPTEGPLGVRFPNVGPVSALNLGCINLSNCLYTYGLVLESTGHLNTVAVDVGGSTQWKYAFLCDETNAVANGCLVDFSTSKYMIDDWGTHIDGIRFDNAVIYSHLIHSPDTWVDDSGITFSYIAPSGMAPPAPWIVPADVNDPVVRLGYDPNGALILGSTTTGGTLPYIDWHYGGSPNYDARLQVTGTNTMTLAFGGNLPGQIGKLALRGGLQVATIASGSLPGCNVGNEGDMYLVNDAASPTYNGLLTGGGSSVVTTVCDGTNWRTH